MSLPIAEDEIDDDDDVEVERSVAVKALPPKSKPSSDRLPIISNVEEECYWCGEVFDKSKMKRILMAGLPGYKCERC